MDKKTVNGIRFNVEELKEDEVARVGYFSVDEAEKPLNGSFMEHSKEGSFYKVYVDGKLMSSERIEDI